jgi:hypothetical protein
VIERSRFQFGAEVGNTMMEQCKIISHGCFEHLVGKLFLAEFLAIFLFAGVRKPVLIPGSVHEE